MRICHRAPHLTGRVTSRFAGDTIISVNGQLVNHHAEAVSAIDKVRDIVKLVVLGESQEIIIPHKSESNRMPIGLTLGDHESPQVR